MDSLVMEFRFSFFGTLLQKGSPRISRGVLGSVDDPNQLWL